MTLADCGEDVPGWRPFLRRKIEGMVFGRFDRIATANAARIDLLSAGTIAAMARLLTRS
jgi:hypothetical protein